VFDVATLTLDEVGEEIDKCLDKLQRLQALQAAMMEQDHRRVKKLIDQFNRLKREQKEKDAVSAGSNPDASAAQPESGDGA
jgi:hypothetical protein